MVGGWLCFYRFYDLWNSTNRDIGVVTVVFFKDGWYVFFL